MARILADVRYAYHNGERWVVIEYADKSERHLRIHQALQLWQEVMPKIGCEAPCFFESDTDIAPATCSECKLCAVLNGLVGERRPPPIRQPQPRSGAAVVIVVLLCIVAVLLGLLAQAGAVREDVRVQKETRR